MLRKFMARVVIIPAFAVLLSGLLSPALAQETTPVPAWDGQTRFTLLLMGMDRRPGEGPTLTTRTDAMMLVSIDPASESVGILHIPRDLHFAPPNSSDFIRANTLLQEGDALQEGYGPYFAMDTLQYNLGMYVHRYVLFDFQAFIVLIDAIGGIDITTTYTIDDPTFPDMNGGYDPFYLPRGTHRLDGYTALQYARTRHGDNDYVRGLRQIQVVMAIYERITTDGEVVPRLLRQAPDLLAAVRGSVYSDLTLEDMIQLGLYLTSVPTENIHTDTINTQFTMTYARPTGGSVRIPDRSRIAELLVEVFGDNYTQ